MAEIKRVTLHPLKPSGAIDENVNLYPKTLIDGIVDRNGDAVEVALNGDLSAKADKVGPLPSYDVLLTDNIYDFINNNSLDNKAVILNLDGDSYILGNHKVTGVNYAVELENLVLKNRYYYSGVLTSMTFSNLISNTYKQNYASDNEVVHNTKNETITGNKTFTGDVTATNLKSTNEIKLDQYDLLRSARLKFVKRNNLDRLSLDIYANDMLTNVVFPGELDDAVELAIKDDITNFYRHHFDIVLLHSDLSTIPEGYQVHINVNALSTSGESWQTLSDLDGGGFIIAAFGTIAYPQVLYTHIFELKIFYKSLETLLVNIHDLTDGSVKAVALTSVFGGVPSEFQLEDSVTKL